MKSAKASLFSVVVAGLLCVATGPAFAASLGDTWGLYINDALPGMTIEFGGNSPSHQLDEPNLYFYVPDESGGGTSAWAQSWYDGESTCYTTAFNEGLNKINFLDTSTDFPSLAVFSEDWSSAAAALQTAQDLNLDWFTIGSILFDNDYSTATLSGLTWDGDGEPVEGISATFSRAATPLPGAIWLLGSGIVGLAGFRRKIKA